MKIVPYIFPLIPEYKSKPFKRSTLHYKAKCERIFFEDTRFSKKLQDYWTYFIPNYKKTKSKSKYISDWTPKLYVCVSASNYWPTIWRFIKEFENSKIHWKFYMAPIGYERPDKIVFYFGSGNQLKHFVKKLRSLLPKSGFHTLSHTASTSDMGIESKNRKGIYIGMDPPIGESWRMYRSCCIAWANINKEYLESLKGGKQLWFERMNLSNKHEGPYSLTPSPKNNAYIRRYWKIVNP